MNKAINIFYIMLALVLFLFMYLKKIRKDQDIKHRNVIMICFDQYNAWSNLPESFTSQLIGYQAFKKIGIEFTNTYTNTQMCSPARSCLATSAIDTGIIDNIDQVWQYTAVPNLKTLSNDSIAFAFKEYDPNIKTVYLGKNHIDTYFAPNNFYVPRWNISTTNTFKYLGYDKTDERGDAFYDQKHGFISDEKTFNSNSLIGSTDEVYDYINADNNNNKEQGIIPYLKARLLDKKQFFAWFNLVNPHDIMHAFHNILETPSHDVMALPFPFYEEQVKEFNVKPFYWDEMNQNASTKNVNFNLNFFEDNYEDYKNNAESLLYYESFIKDFVTKPENENSTYPFLESCWSGLQMGFTMANQEQITFWKNFQNTYLCMIYHVDKYLHKIYDFLNKSGMLAYTSVSIIADHGEMAGAHGLKQKGFHYRECSQIPNLIYSPDFDISLKGIRSVDTICNLYDVTITLPTLALINHINTPRQIGQSLFSINHNNKLIINSKLRNESFSFVRNWMMWTSSIPYLLSVAQLENKNRLNPIASPLDLLWMFVNHTKMIDGKKYTYTIYFGLNSLAHNFKLKFRDLLIQKKFLGLEQLKSKCNDKIYKSINNFFENNNPDKDILVTYKEYRFDSLIVRIIVSFILIRFVFLVMSGMNVGTNDDINKINMELPFITKTRKRITQLAKQGYYLEILYNDTDDPSQSVNLLDPKRDVSTEDNDIANVLYNNIVKNAEVNLQIKHTVFPVLDILNSAVITILIKMIERIYTTNPELNISETKINYVNEINEILKNEENLYLTVTDIFNMIQSLGGLNNFDAPGFEVVCARNTIKFISYQFTTKY